ncbi:putative membrane protein YdfJ with MMPL/SSD domain [Deinococcus metalli]|uniref:Putative membrane protein YdfJ with MMPL/SSD domain n=1 Tax=Deinococcus metalli TaxID=1141878 RepID=A0A7W8KDR8_9DEIO|nr:hypothetical protein [Deinococcus metalli]MBB5376271.1 putative membrane protein YdfJ with MMPL/SSD domain [Deinococcus metalli]GHF39566.1 hypothetical protein GCM10017781_15120 [Deinococcus metalli]
MESVAEILGVLAGALLATVTVTAGAALPPRTAQPGALLGFLALAVLVAAVLVTGDAMARSFGVVYVLLGAVAALALGAPRWLAWPGLERPWVPPGLGVALLLALIGVGLGVDAVLSRMLAPALKAPASSGVVNGLLIGALGAVLFTGGAALRRRR